MTTNGVVRISRDRKTDEITVVANGRKIPLPAPGVSVVLTTSVTYETREERNIDDSST